MAAKKYKIRRILDVTESDAPIPLPDGVGGDEYIVAGKEGIILRKHDDKPFMFRARASGSDPYAPVDTMLSRILYMDAENYGPMDAPTAFRFVGRDNAVLACHPDDYDVLSKKCKELCKVFATESIRRGEPLMVRSPAGYAVISKPDSSGIYRLGICVYQVSAVAIAKRKRQA